MKELNRIFHYLQSRGFRITQNDGTRRKIFPPDKNMPFYSIHIGEKAIHPLVRFARKNWGIDLTEII